MNTRLTGGSFCLDGNRARLHLSGRALFGWTGAGAAGRAATTGPRLGRFLTVDPYLLINQDKIPPLLAAANLYVFAYCSPVNFTDPTGEIAPLLVAIIVAAIVGAIIGAIGAGVNGARTWDEWLLWIVVAR